MNQRMNSTVRVWYFEYPMSESVDCMNETVPCHQVLSKSTDGDLPLSSESGVYTALHDLTKSFERTPAISSWKTIKPPPTSLIWKVDQADKRFNASTVSQLPQ